MSTNRDGSRAGKRVLPTWIFLLISIGCFMALLGMGLYELFLRMGIGIAGTWIVIAYAVVATIQISALVGSVLVLVYLFNWLQEVRRILRQIDQNTRFHNVGYHSQSVAHAHLTPVTPPDYNYMPKA